MLNNAPREHEYYEQLCALDALGDMAESERAELHNHLAGCTACRMLAADFTDIVKVGIPAALERQSLPFRMRMSFQRRRFRARFAEKAAARGIAVPESEEGQGWKLQAALAAAVVLAVITGTLVMQLQTGETRAAAAERTTAALRARIAELESRPAAASAAPVERIVRVEEKVPVSDPAALKRIEALQRDYDSAEQELARVREELSGARKDLESTRLELAGARGSASQAAEHLQLTEVAYRQASDELTRLRAARTNDAAALATQQTRIRELTNELQSRGDVVDRDMRLIAADRDIRELMGARNLHIVDVFDVDGKGKTNRPFGRVFYTEGKSLVFYAFDLGTDKVRKANASFQAWGQRETKTASARSLGIFYVDDQKQNRWVLKFDDPSVLAQIDAVFVTVEPSGGSTKPNGQKLLYAYLNATPNHP